ncbi:MAG: amino acid permease [Bacteroidia bacterium]|nr:amino acid permease [Bacteroidia bacterium]
MFKKAQKIGWVSAGAIVVANMIGTGVFTSLGFQLSDITNTWSILLLWTLGGLIAIAGAFAYAELGSHYGRSGGEYHYLTELYHPLVGYLAGWISLSVGFAAPIALAAIAMGGYLENYWSFPAKAMALSVVILISLVHSFSIRQSSDFQNISTGLKILIIASLVLFGLMVAPEQSALDYSLGWSDEIFLPAFGIALVYVTYSYTGWNAAAYIIEEIKDPVLNLPKALIRGTFIVTLLYVLMQFVFLKHASIDQMKGQVDVGHIVAANLFGDKGGMIISYLIAVFLISSISAMVWVGPRVSMVMAQDYKLWSFLGKTNKKQIPVRAIWFQAIISLVLILTGTFEQVLLYCGFILMLSSLLCVLGTFKLHMDRTVKLKYTNPTYPWFPAFFVVIGILILSFMIYEKPVESLLGLVNILIGIITYFVSLKMIEND